MIGIVGVLLRRNALIIMMGVELMLNAANLPPRLLPHARRHLGQAFAMFVIAVAAAEAAVGLAIVVALFRGRRHPTSTASPP